MANFYQKNFSTCVPAIPSLSSRWLRQRFTSSHCRRQYFTPFSPCRRTRHPPFFTLHSSLFTISSRLTNFPTYGTLCLFPASPRAKFFDNQIPYHIYPTDTVRHLVGRYLDLCPICPETGSRTASDTVSDLCSNTVRFSLNGCPKFGNRTTGEQSQTRCRTLPRHVSETSENWQSDSVGHRVGFMLKHCPIFPQRVSENWQADSSRTLCRSYAQDVSDVSGIATKM